jgi:putative ABC transport system substrate-binding protein
MRRREFIAGLGGAAVWPLLVRAQQRTKPTIAWLDVQRGGPWPENIEGIRRGLAEIGFLEGRDVTVEYHTADSHIERLSALAADVVRQTPAAIIAISTVAAFSLPKRRPRRYQTFLQRALIRSSLAWWRA